MQRPGGHRHPGGSRRDDRHHHTGPHLLRVGGDPMGPPLCPHSHGGGGRVLSRLLKVRQHCQGEAKINERNPDRVSCDLIVFVGSFGPAGSYTTLQRQRTGREAIHLDPDSPEERAVAAELAAKAQLHAAQQLGAEGHREPA